MPDSLNRLQAALADATIESGIGTGRVRFRAEQSGSSRRYRKSEAHKFPRACSAATRTSDKGSDPRPLRAA